MRVKGAVSGFAAALMLLFAEARADEPPDRALGFFLPDPDAAARWRPVLGLLESDSFAEREAASRELGALPALPAFLREMAASERRPESRIRLGELLVEEGLISSAASWSLLFRSKPRIKGSAPFFARSKQRNPKACSTRSSA